MRLVAFAGPATEGFTPRPGILVPAEGLVIDLVSLGELTGFAEHGTPPADVLHWLDMDGPWFRFARAAAGGPTPGGGEPLPPGTVRPLGEVSMLAPVPRPGKIVAVGLNYRDHAAEAGLPVPETPVIFGKFPSAVIGPGQPIVLPAGSRRVDYEGELGVVIGRRVRRVSRQDALGAVLGFVPANDVSDRDVQKADGQWVRAKSCDTFAPLGPAIVTLDELVRPDALGIELRLNGHTMQRSNTSEFIFDVPALVAFIADTITLEPGDVILTGTPAGVGFARRPPAYLRDGDSVEVEIDGLGVLRNPVVGSSTGREA